MADRITNYSLGSAGVILDPHHLLPGVPAEGLTVAQNATHDPSAGFGGALRKRPGFARFNTTYAGGVILGGIMMPVAGFGGAPAAGGGAIIGTGDVADGTSTGTGDMTGAPGAVFSGSSAAAGSASAFTGGSSLFGGGRLLAIGLDDNVGSNDGGRAWYLTTKNMTATAVKVTTPQGPCRVYSFPTFVAPYANGLQGSPACIGMDGRLYYAASHGNQSTGGDVSRTVPIYVTDGATSSLLANLLPFANNLGAYFVDGTGSPPADGTIRGAVMSMHAATDGFLYITVKWKYTGQTTAGSAGSVFRVRPTTGEVVEWNMGTTATIDPAAYTNIPYCSNYFQGYLFVGEANNVDAGAANIVATNGTLGANELTSTDFNNVTCLIQFNGRLFAGTGITKAAGTGLALLISRKPTGGIGIGYGGWDNHSFDVGRTGNTTNGNSYSSMVIFNSALYVAWNAPATATKIYKVVANSVDPASTSFTITTAYAGAAGNGPLNLYVDDGVIYGISSGDSVQNIAVSSTDGASWTDRSAQFGSLGTNSFAVPVLYGMNQS